MQTPDFLSILSFPAPQFHALQTLKLAGPRGLTFEDLQQQVSEAMGNNLPGADRQQQAVRSFRCSVWQSVREVYLHEVCSSLSLMHVLQLKITFGYRLGGCHLC